MLCYHGLFEIRAPIVLFTSRRELSYVKLFERSDVQRNEFDSGNRTDERNDIIVMSESNR